jgi:hypothetical protein
MKILRILAPITFAVALAASGCASQETASAGATNTHLIVIGQRPRKPADHSDSFYQRGNWDFLKPLRDPSEDWRGGN